MAAERRAGFGWLHLTDLHVGIGADRYLWDNHEDDILDDLRKLHAHAGPWDLLFFTGDLTQRGSPDELEAFDARLSRVMATIRELQDGEPMFLAVPGNHDLRRPKVISGPVALAKALQADPGVRDDFWANGDSELRRAVGEAFGGWTSWWAMRSAGLPDHRQGLLPGEYSASLEVAGLRVGVLGLNSAALHLYDVERGALSLDPRQVNAACGEGSKPWTRRHDFCFLLTHHPPDWLDAEGRCALDEDIYPPETFVQHLFGHAHEGAFQTWTVGAGPERGRLLGRSLFGLEWQDAARRQERMMGYLAGRCWMEGRQRRSQLWPRSASRIAGGGGWQITADADHYRLVDDRATRVLELGETPRPTPPRPKASAATATPPVVPRGTSPLPGWELIEADWLRGQRRSLEREELTLYFDGRIPSWAHAVTEQIPRRDVVAATVAALRGARVAHLVRLIGPSGEGKSTALRQIVADLVLGEEGFKALWWEEGDISADRIKRLPSGRWLLAIDEADAVATDVVALVKSLAGGNRRDLHVLIAARDTDWRKRIEVEPAWSQWMQVLPRVASGNTLTALEAAEAERIVRSWADAGALGALETVAEGSRASELVRLTRADAASSSGSLFGGVLAARFDPEGLLAHLNTLLDRLQHHEDGVALYDAFLYVAAIDAIGGPELEGLDQGVLSDLTGARGRDMQRLLRRLGEEAAAGRAGGTVRTRHRNIARAALVVAQRDFGEDLGEIYARVVLAADGRAAARVHVEGIGKLMHLGPLLLKHLPTQIPEEQRQRIAIRAQQTAAESDEEDSRPLVSLADTWRKVGDPGRAAAVLRTAVLERRRWRDHAQSFRGVLHQWGVAIGVAGDPCCSTWLTGLSLADLPGVNPVDQHRAVLSLSAAGAAWFNRAGPPIVYTRLLAATAVLGPRVTGSGYATNRAFFDRHHSAPQAAGVPVPTPDLAFTWFVEAIRAAHEALEDPEVAALADPSRLTFDGLRRVLGLAAPSSKAGGQ